MIAYSENIKVFTGNSNPEFAKTICKELGIELGRADVKHFADGEASVTLTETVRGADVFLIQSTCKPVNDNLMELLVMIDACSRASAGRITAVIPYFGYARQDRKAKSRDPISSKLVANMLTAAGADRILTMDLHADQIQGFFDIPLDHLYAAPVMLPYMQEKLKIGADAVVVSPDSGSVKMAHSYADRLNCGFAVVAKRRVSASVVESSHLVGDVAGRDCIICDDMTSTCGTLCAAADLLKKEGAQNVYAVVTHCLLTDAGVEKLEKSAITQLITTDSVPYQASRASDKVHAVSIAPLLAQAIKRIHFGESVSDLFRYSEED